MTRDSRAPHVVSNFRKWALAFACILSSEILLLTSGCELHWGDHEIRAARSYIYYLDGSGAGILLNWRSGLANGLLKAGYEGYGEDFAWQSGLGVVADHTSSVDYKREKARQLIQRITEYRKQHPKAPVHLIGLSAGTAVLLYALETLPSDYQIENAVLLGSSVSRNYDLTQALERVNNRMYVFTSRSDTVIGSLVPSVGTADRASGSVSSAGLEGFVAPVQVSDRTRRNYAKLVHVPWRSEFRRLGHPGGHTDAASERFVREYIAPLLIGRGGAYVPQRLTGQTVPDLDFKAWEPYRVGSSVTYEGDESIGGKKRQISFTESLALKLADRVFVETTLQPLKSSGRELPRRDGFFARPRMNPEADPRTHPGSKITSGSKESIAIMGKEYLCDVSNVQVDANLGDYWSRNLVATLYSTKDIPWHMAAFKVQGQIGNARYEYDVRLVETNLVLKDTL